MKKITLVLATTLLLIATTIGCREKKSTGEKVEDAVEESAEEVEDAVEDATDDN